MCDFGKNVSTFIFFKASNCRFHTAQEFEQENPGSPTWTWIDRTSPSWFGNVCPCPPRWAKQTVSVPAAAPGPSKCPEGHSGSWRSVLSTDTESTAKNALHSAAHPKAHVSIVVANPLPKQSWFPSALLQKRQPILWSHLLNLQKPSANSGDLENREGWWCAKLPKLTNSKTCHWPKGHFQTSFCTNCPTTQSLVCFCNFPTIGVQPQQLRPQGEAPKKTPHPSAREVVGQPVKGGRWSQPDACSSGRE